MATIGRTTVWWTGLLATIESVVGNWRPPKLMRETQYRDHLLAALQRAVPTDARVEKEYRHLGTTTDLWVRWQGMFWTDEVFVELKVNLTKKADYDRLVGQIEILKPSENKTLVVLIGDANPSLVGRLKDRYALQITNSVQNTMAIVCVPLPT